MALPIISVPAYASVPNAPGLPALVRDVTNLLPLPLVALADSFNLGGFLKPVWGIIDDAGSPILLGDAIEGIEFQQDNRKSDYPTEQGGFDTYNKVKGPYLARLSIVVGAAFSSRSIGSALQSGSIVGALKSLTGETARAEFMSTLAALCDSLQLVTVITPEAIYYNANITRYDYRRSVRNGGSTMIIADITLEEVRQTETTKFTQTKAPAGLDTVNGGTVSTSTVTSETLPAPK